MTITENTLTFACPDTDEPLVARIDDLGRMTVEPAEEPEEGATGQKLRKATNRWIERLYGTYERRPRQYLAVTSSGDARRQLTAKGVEWQA